MLAMTKVEVTDDLYPESTHSIKHDVVLDPGEKTIDKNLCIRIGSS
jgi:hypothetical protein